MTYKKEEILLLFAHSISRLGDQSWSFCVPIALVLVSDGALWVTSFVAITGRVVILTIGVWLGRYIDCHERLTVIKVATAVSTLSILVGLVSFVILMDWAPINSCLQDNLLYWIVNNDCSWKTISMFICLSLAASGEAVGAFLSRISVERDWVVEVVSDSDLPHFTAVLRQIDLFAEIVAPVVVGWFLNNNNSQVITVYFIAIGCFNAISFLIEFYLLQWIWLICHLYSHPTNDNSSEGTMTSTEECSDNENTQTNQNTFTLFLQHPLSLVVLAYGCLWFNALSPHGILFTSYLYERRIDNIFLGIFRAMGALVGLFATFCFPFLERRMGLRSTSLWAILLEAITLIISYLLIDIYRGSLTALNWSLLFIVISRLGLYLFELGEALYLQRSIDTSQRGRMGAAEALVTNTGTLTILLGGLFLNKVSSFRYMWLFSVSFTSLGALTFIIWLILFIEDEHYHDPTNPLALKHPHSLKQQQELNEHGQGWHYHLRRR
eukprot:jgi/Galph1/1135/GphlegSOOS_G5825.1